MTVLRVEDLDLHHEDGTHIDPGKDRAVNRALNLHLARHAQGALPDLGMLATDLEQAEQRVKDAEGDLIYTREYVMKIVREHMAAGAKQYEIAKKLRISEKALYDFLRFGRRRGGANRS